LAAGDGVLLSGVAAVTKLVRGGGSRWMSARDAQRAY